MAHLHNINHRQNPSLLSSIGSKIRHAAEIAGAVKGIYDKVGCYIMLLNISVLLLRMLGRYYNCYTLNYIIQNVWKDIEGTLCPSLF